MVEALDFSNENYMRSTKLTHDAIWMENEVASFKKLANGYLLKEFRL